MFLVITHSEANIQSCRQLSNTWFYLILHSPYSTGPKGGEVSVLTSRAVYLVSIGMRVAPSPLATRIKALSLMVSGRLVPL